MKRSLITIFLVLMIDQVLKIWIKTHMIISEEYPVFGDWFIIHFTENNGMAFGMELEGEFGKLFLSIFRIVAIFAIGWYLYGIIGKKGHPGFIISISLIMAGAIGNIIDSAFYGLIFSESYHQLAVLFPEGGGYANFLHGSVVDMFYFPIINGHFPAWFPFWGSQQFIFFRPVFNIADASITIGVALIILFQKMFFTEREDGMKTEAIGSGQGQTVSEIDDDSYPTDIH